MTYGTVVREMILRFPKLEDSIRERMSADEPLPYIAMGCVLIPHLEEALQYGSLAVIVAICAYLEDMAVSSAADPLLADLIGIQIGEWIGHAPYEDRLAPWLGAETKRLTGYVPGLATQRLQLKAKKEAKRRSSLAGRLLAKCRGSEW